MVSRVATDAKMVEASQEPSPAVVKKAPGRLLGILRTLAVDLPLALLFFALMLTYFAQHLYTEYYPRLLEQYERNDDDLTEQFTYYHRYCTTADLTTKYAPDLLVDTNGPVEVAVDKLQTHGGVVIPQLLKPETAQRLREYVDQRNRAIQDTERFPMYPPQNRLSYGFDATESPAVVQAIQEVSNNPFFYQMMSQVLGDEDPALTELTTITSFYGAEDQGWHADVKEFGNALKFSRSYTHTYSLFLALQNITFSMGATEICPGTHYCANPLEEVCEVNRMSLADVAGNGQIGAGDGALLNQMAWHRGAAHSDPNAPERILFIMTFLARPRHDRDPRQFAKGTYFHLKWNMWGHTWKDLQNPIEYMKAPYSILRALSLWKPSSRNWGYDMVTSVSMQLANEMLHGDELRRRVTPKLDAIGFPQWLRGPLREDDLEMQAAWKLYWDGTIGKTLAFLSGVNFAVHLLYGIFVAVLSLSRQKTGGGMKFFTRSVARILVTHGAICMVFWLACHLLANTECGKRILAGKEMFDPFPPVRILKEEELAFVPTGPTTFPASSDVMFGTRFDAKWLGSYDRYLDFHKGNVKYLQAVKSKAMLYHKYRGLPEIFQQRLLLDIMRTTEESGGRFLEQDFRIGTWHVLADSEILGRIQEDLIIHSSPLKKELILSINRRIADYRFLKLRETIMGSKSWQILHRLKKLVLKDRSLEITKVAQHKHARFLFGWTGPNMSLPLPHNQAGCRPAHLRVTPLPAPKRSPYQLGTKVYVLIEDDEDDPLYFRGDIVDISDTTPPKYTVDTETSEHFSNLIEEDLTLYKPVTEGDRVHGCFSTRFRDCFPGTIVRVMPDLSVAISYDDGDFDNRKERNMYYMTSWDPEEQEEEHLTYFAPENWR